MNNERKPLAVRRAELISQCAGQRAYLAQELAVLRAPIGADGWLGRLAANKKLVLAAAGLATGFALLHPKRLLAAAGGALAMVKAVRSLLPLLPR